MRSIDVFGWLPNFSLLLAARIQPPNGKKPLLINLHMFSVLLRLPMIQLNGGNAEHIMMPSDENSRPSVIGETLMLK
ncbi:MAG TPA: hypothetical protein DDZ88_23450 [Verrucomicrobiales bacterium]|nr:hypothetical protein [Verrucomicrobiales bacterium]